MAQHQESHDSHEPIALPTMIAAISRAAAHATSPRTFLQNWLQAIGDTWPEVSSAAAYGADGESLLLTARYSKQDLPPEAQSVAKRAVANQSVIAPESDAAHAIWGLPLWQETTIIGAYSVVLPTQSASATAIGSTLTDLQNAIALALARFHVDRGPGSNSGHLMPLLTVLNQIARQLSISTDNTTTFNTICSNLALIPGMLYAAIIGFEKATATQVVLAQNPILLDLSDSQALGDNSLRSYVEAHPTPSILQSVDEIAQLLGKRVQASNALSPQGLLVVPLREHNEFVGTLLLAAETTNLRLSQSEIYIMEAIAAQIALSLRNTTLNQSIQFRADQIEQTTVFGRLVTSTFDNTEIMQYVADIVPRLLDCDHVSLVLYTAGQLQMTFYELRPESPLHPVALSAGGSSVEEVVRSYTPIALDDLSRSTYTDHKRLANNNLCATIVVPLLASKQPLGTLSVAHRRTGVYTHTDLTLLQQIGTQVAIALENASLYHSAQQRAVYEEALSAITSRLQQQSDLRVMLEQTMQDLGATLGANRARVRLQLGPHDEPSQ